MFIFKEVPFTIEPIAYDQMISAQNSSDFFFWRKEEQHCALGSGKVLLKLKQGSIWASCKRLVGRLRNVAVEVLPVCSAFVF